MPKLAPRVVTKPGWRDDVRRRYGLRRVRYVLMAGGVLMAWLAVSLAAFVVWTMTFRHGPNPRAALAAFEAIGFGLVAAFVRYGPIQPLRGKSPEEVAAEAFLANRDVRSDDGLFDLDKEPGARRSAVLSSSAGSAWDHTHLPPPDGFAACPPP